MVFASPRLTLREISCSYADVPQRTCEEARMSLPPRRTLVGPPVLIRGFSLVPRGMRDQDALCYDVFTLLLPPARPVDEKVHDFEIQR